MKFVNLFQVFCLLFLLYHNNLYSQEKFILTQEDMPDYKLVDQSISPWRIAQQWKMNNSDYSLYFYYYEYEDEYIAIKLASDNAQSYARPYFFGFPSGEIRGNSSWTSSSRNAAYIQKWNVVVQIFDPLEGIKDVKNVISNVSDKLLAKIGDSISTEFPAKDTKLKKYQVPLASYNQITVASRDTLASNGFSEYKVEDSKWIFNTDSLVMGIRKQWSTENSIFSIDLAEFKNDTNAQKAVEQNAYIKGGFVFLLDDEKSLEKAISDWISYWSQMDNMKYISVVGRTGNYAIHFYCFAENNVDLGLFKRIIQATTKMGTGISNNKTVAIEVYPNPATDFITITNPTTEPEKCLLHLFDSQGRLLLKKEVEISGNYRLDISEIKNGIYFLNLRWVDKQFTKQIIKTDFK